jgi:hypothetical protein
MWIQLVASLALYQFIGGIWYSPLMFQKTFVRTNSRRPEDHQMSLWMLLACFILGGLEVFGLYYALNLLGVRGGQVCEGAKYGYLIWQFFVFPMFAVHYIFDPRPIMHLVMVSSHHLATLVANGALIAYLRP